MKLGDFLENLSGSVENPEDLVSAIEEATHFGMNHLYILISRSGSRAVLVLHINPYTEDLLSLVMIIPIGCGDRAPSIEEAGMLARRLGGAIMATGDCSYILVGYDQNMDLSRFIETIFGAISPGSWGLFRVEDYSYDLLSLYQEDLG
jgi:hypothetical protein